MDADFHFHATFYAAVLAGYEPQQAKVIASAGQFIDDCDENQLADAPMKDGIQPLATALPFGQVMDHAGLSSTSELIARDRRMWTAFHFLPGNLDYRYTYQGLRYDVGLLGERFHYDDLAEMEFRSMCLPDSPLVLKMLEDSRQHKDDLHLLGIRMHALIDTFAHMLYCGSAAWHVNDVGPVPTYKNGSSWLAFAVPIHATVNQYYDSVAYTGHGRMGHIPDYPWVTYSYKPQWSQDSLVKDNPAMYYRAFKEMTNAMYCVRNNIEYKVDALTLEGDLDQLVKEIIAYTPKSSSLGEIFYDWTDMRSDCWKDALPKFKACKNSKAVTSDGVNLAANLQYLPDSAAYPEYKANDDWLRDYKNGKGQDYYRFQVAANAHLSLVDAYLKENNLPLFGKSPFVTKDSMASILDRDVYIQLPPKKGETPEYWEVENSSEDDGTPVQLWNKDAGARVWQIKYAGQDKHGNDVFNIFNTKLKRYVTFWFDWGKDDLDGFQIRSFGRKGSAQSFPLVRHPDGTFSVYVTDTFAMIPASGNRGNSTKIVSRRMDADHPEWGKWLIVQVP